jgi:YHS domain-containing protein
MTPVQTLESRIDAAFMSVAEKAKKFQDEQMDAYKARQKRLEQLAKDFETLRGVWKPRLDILVKKFGERVKVTPKLLPSTREAIFDFTSSQARVRLTLSAYTDAQIENVYLSYDLEILPILMQYLRHSDIRFPLGKADTAAAEKWIDDRLVDFVQAYLSIGETAAYVKDSMVEDPIAQIQFPSLVAATSLEWGGKKYWFISEETRAEFVRKNHISAA